MTILEYFFKAFDSCSKLRGLSQKQVAEFTGINENDMSRYRNGKRGMGDVLKAKVADFFGYDLLDFLNLGRSSVPCAESAPNDSDKKLTDELETMRDSRDLWKAKAAELEAENAKLKKILGSAAEFTAVLCGDLPKAKSMMNDPKLNEHAQPPARFNQKAREARSSSEMIGICKGVIADGLVCEAEARFMLTWLEANPEAVSSWPGDRLAARLAAIWADNVVTDEELGELKELIADLTGLISPAAAELPHNLSTQLPIDTPEPQVTITGRSFCFTGKMVDASRKVCEDRTVKSGGAIQSAPTQKLDYLVVGFLGSRDWKFSSHGTKILKAIELKESGHPIKIISEQAWLKALPITI